MKHFLHLHLVYVALHKLPMIISYLVCYRCFIVLWTLHSDCDTLFTTYISSTCVDLYSVCDNKLPYPLHMFLHFVQTYTMFVILNKLPYPLQMFLHFVQTYIVFVIISYLIHYRCFFILCRLI